MAKGGNFEVRVPIEFEGSKVSGATKGGGDNKELTKAVKKLDKTMFMNLDIVEMLSTIMGDVFKMFQPLIKVLSLLLFMVFLPMLPVIIQLTKWIAKLAAAMPKVWDFIIEGLTSFIQMFIDIGYAITDAIRWLIDKIIQGAEWVWEQLLKLGEIFSNAATWIWEKIIMAFEFLNSIGEWIRNFIIGAFEFLGDIGSWIWNDIIKPAFEFLMDVGSWIWDLIKAPFVWLADKIRTLWDKINIFGRGSDSVDSGQDFIIRPNGQMIKTSPSDTIFATKDPSKLMGGGGSIAININNPIVRNDQDIKKIAEQVSTVLNRQLRGRISI